MENPGEVLSTTGPQSLFDQCGTDLKEHKHDSRRSYEDSRGREPLQNIFPQCQHSPQGLWRKPLQFIGRLLLKLRMNSTRLSQLPPARVATSHGVTLMTPCNAISWWLVSSTQTVTSDALPGAHSFIHQGSRTSMGGQTRSAPLRLIFRCLELKWDSIVPYSSWGIF